MKRFGVQLAGSGIVILLGALGVAQAQRDSRTAETTQWDENSVPSLTPPPAPIAALDSTDDQSAVSGPATLGFGSFEPSPVAMQDSPVRTVAHEEPIEPTGSAAPASIGLPLMPESADSDELDTDAAQGPGIALPAWSMPPTSTDSQVSTNSMSPEPTMGSNTAMEMPGSIPSSESKPPVSQAGEDYAALPTLQFDSAPANGLRGSESEPPAQQSGPPVAYESANPTMPLDAYPKSQPGQSPAMTPAMAPTQSMAELHPIEEMNAQSIAVPLNPEPAARIASLPTAALPQMAQSPAPVDARIDEIVIAEPGDRRLEGSQSPSIIIQKRAPEEVKVGKPATFVIYVQNTGGVEALDVRVHDRVPIGMRLVDASPQPNIQDDLLSWNLGAIEPGGERTVTMQLIPEREGELGSVARVTFEAAASVRTISTRPELKIVQRAPEQVLIGQQLEIELEVSNPGSGAATGVVLQEDVPEGLEHPKGRQLDNVIGTLAPGEVRRQVLRLRAVAPGKISNQVRLSGDDGLLADHTVMVEVVAPQLAIELEGPSKRFLERQAVFNVNLANVGTADATNVEVVAYLDRGFSFVATEYQGQYDPSRHAVYWSLAELPAQGRGSVPLKLLPIEQGERAIRLEARGDLNTISQHEKVVSIDTLAELTFSITDDADPIEIGSEATYEIRISNRGSRDDSDVRLQMLLPPGLELVASEAEASTNDRGLIAFAPTLTLPAGQETVHRIRVRGTGPGTHVVKAIVTSAQATVPVTKEESTMVYADN